MTATNTSTIDFYDAENRLIKRDLGGGQTNVIVYDHDGNRVRKMTESATTYYLLDDRNLTGYVQILAEYLSLETNSVPERVYTFGHDLISEQLSVGIYYYGYDGHGSVRLLLDDDEEPTDWYDYDAYGKLLASSTNTLNNYRYTGEQWDSDFGMYFLRARYYRPDTGRFWTMDTYEGTRNDPLSLHKYLYAHANPINRVNPSGHAAYYVQRQFEDAATRDLYPLSGHGYLLFTDPNDLASGDPFGWFPRNTIIGTFSWHPNSWNSKPGEKVPGRVWENHTTDMVNPGRHETFLITDNPAQQAALLNHIRSWIAAAQPGYDLGAPEDDENDLGNQIGREDHREAPQLGVYYSLFEQNCVWWATIMMMQSNVQVDPSVYNAIRRFNAGGGAGNDVVLGRRSAHDVRRLGIPRQFTIPRVIEMNFSPAWATFSGF